MKLPTFNETEKLDIYFDICIQHVKRCLHLNESRDPDLLAGAKTKESIDAQQCHGFFSTLGLPQRRKHKGKLDELS